MAWHLTFRQPSSSRCCHRQPPVPSPAAREMPRNRNCAIATENGKQKVHIKKWLSISIFEIALIEATSGGDRRSENALSPTGVLRGFEMIKANVRGHVIDYAARSRDPQIPRSPLVAPLELNGHCRRMDMEIAWERNHIKKEISIRKRSSYCNPFGLQD